MERDVVGCAEHLEYYDMDLDHENEHAKKTTFSMKVQSKHH